MNEKKVIEFKCIRDNAWARFDEFTARGVTVINFYNREDGFFTVTDTKRRDDRFELNMSFIAIKNNAIQLNLPQTILDTIKNKFVYIEMRNPTGSWFIMPSDRDYRYDFKTTVNAFLTFRKPEFFFSQKVEKIQPAGQEIEEIEEDSFRIKDRGCNIS